jgi:prepilin-type processing-associated H-X9-DG protein
MDQTSQRLLKISVAQKRPVPRCRPFLPTSFLKNLFLGEKEKMKDVLMRGRGSKAEVFIFAEENMWMRQGNSNVLNDNALCPDGRDWFGTFHSASSADLNSGTVNAVFVDAHVQELRSALGPEGLNNTLEMEFGRFEKHGWPRKEPFQ